MNIENSTNEWYAKVMTNEAELCSWLKNQYRGEATAAARIRTLIIADIKDNPQLVSDLEAIAVEEETHAQWIGELLTARGIPLPDITKQERYWPKATKAIKDADTGCAIAAHAEGMRLVRIKALVDYAATPDDIRKVFLRILPQEIRHEATFRRAATPEALVNTALDHIAGMRELGLVP